VRANVLTVFNAILGAFGVVTLLFGDWRDALFLGVIVANSGIGITQEVRAKRSLDRLALLVAPHGEVLRDGVARKVPVGALVPGDLVLLSPGEQIVADGHVLVANELLVDESILSGESEPARREVGEEVRSGAFVVEGTGVCEVTAVGAESFAERLTGQARSFRHPRSPLERAINRLLYALVALVVGLGALLGYSLYHRHVPLHTAVATSTAGVVSLIPEGLVVLVSLTYAVAAVRMSRRGILAQQLNAIESLASVDTLCVDKTGTLTQATLRVVGVSDGEALPDDPVELRRFALEATVVGRISPEGKQAFVRALGEAGRYVAMIGDGVNDVPALKSSRLAIAQGAGTQMARSVADLVLVSGDFDTVPVLVAEGRQALRNLQRVTKLYLTKSAFAAFLILTIGVSSEAYPLLPRHLTLAASLTIGIPTFFLALAPSSGRWRPEHFVRRAARFAVPAGVVLGTGVVAGYLFALHDLDLSLTQARTVAVTTLIAGGLYLVLALEAEGSARRSTLVGVMCAALGGAYVAVLLIASTRRFFELATPDAAVIATALLAGAVSIGALIVCGFTVRAGSTTPTEGAT